jgi:hypothetical protein
VAGAAVWSAAAFACASFKAAPASVLKSVGAAAGTLATKPFGAAVVG